MNLALRCLHQAELIHGDFNPGNDGNKDIGLGTYETTGGKPAGGIDKTRGPMR